MKSWIWDHPDLLRGVTIGLIVLAAFDLYGAIRLHIKARDLLGQYQKATSEALGG